ncbi:MAG: penicillin acylase family protein, partial [Halobacteriales archaeon]|nr:penicillin acylase family protein [Halobacteriales archaeon]
MTEAMEFSRRGLLGLLVGGIAGGTAVPSATQFLDSFAPLSGQAWDGALRTAPDHIESPYGEATVSFDDYGVPTVEASTDEALYFAVGFVQAHDRLAQMDLQRRLAGGRIAEVVGEGALDSDRFHRTIGFRQAAEASYRELVGEGALDSDRFHLT